MLCILSPIMLFCTIVCSVLLTEKQIFTSLTNSFSYQQKSVVKVSGKYAVSTFRPSGTSPTEPNYVFAPKIMTLCRAPLDTRACC